MMRLLLVILVTLSNVVLGAEGSSVVVLYNSNVPASKSVAEHYAEKRSVPGSQVIGLPMSEKEAISRDEYRSQIAEPFLRRLEELKLLVFDSIPRTNAAGKREEVRAVTSAKIRYAALCFGVPLKIEPDSRINEPGMEQARPEARRNEAAVDNELAILPLAYAKVPVSGPFVNRLYSTTNTGYLNPTSGLLMVARLDGPTPEIAKGLVDKALQAEREGLWGRAYFDSRSITNSGYKMGDEMILASQKTAALHGFETTLDQQPSVFPAGFPMSHIGLYVGWYEFNIAGALAEPKIEFMPGAFAYHLHSFSAQTIRDPNQRWVGPLLARGATCSMGSTEEPYLEGTPEISVFVNRWLFLGYSFAEAAYTCQRFLSWQTTVVGDPLYRPFAKSPKNQHEELIKSKSKLIEWSFLRVANINLATQISPGEIVKFLQKEVPETKTSSILNEKIGDLMKSQGKWIEAMDPYEQALTLDPSPQQRLRISLVLAPLQSSFGRGKQAYAIYQGLLRDYPDYPDKIRIYQKILPLADKFGKPGEAEEYQKALKELTAAAAAPKP
jgi:uncharacterized protein (TIGR03790 family)